LKSEGKEKIENINKTRKYIEKLKDKEYYKKTQKENGEMLGIIIEGIKNGNEEETELLKLIEEIKYKISLEHFITYDDDYGENYFLSVSGVYGYLENKMSKILNGKEKSKESEYYIILSYCHMNYSRDYVDEKILKKVNEFFKELKMDEINTIEEKKKRLKEMLGLCCFIKSIGFKNNIKQIK